MKDFLKTVLATMVGLLLYSVVFFFLLVGIAGIVASLGAGSKTVIVKPNSVLHLNFKSDIVERASDNSFDFSSLLGDMQPSTGLNEILKSIELAKTDDRIKGIFIENEDVPAGLATIDEIRQAIVDFKSSGKLVYAYADNMTQGSYYLSSAADKIVLNPLGELTFKGLRAEITFYKGLLDKLGVEVQVYRHGKFKSAVEPYLLSKMSDENRLQYQVMLDNMWNRFVQNVSESRNIASERLNQIADGGLVQAPYYLQTCGLIDGEAYRSDVLDDFASALGIGNAKDINFISVKKYAKSEPNVSFGGPKIAVIYASGEINKASSGYSTEAEITPKAYLEALKDAREDSTIKAVVLRVNSPGGDAQASDVIWHEVELTNRVKPVIVSMGDYAASGGYYISCPASRIVADEFTLTGSIGVFGLGLNIQKLMESRLGITADVVKTNKLSDMGSSYRKATPAEREIIQSSVEKVYNTFVSRVSNGRNMSPDRVDSIGQGRVWCGIDARRLGLVDEFGGLTKSISVAAELANVESYSLVELPKEVDPIESMLKAFTEEMTVRKMNSELGEFAKSAQYIRDLMESQGVKAQMENLIEIY